MEVLLKEWAWPDGFSPEERENQACLAPKRHLQAPDTCQVSAVDEKKHGNAYG